MQSTEVWVEVAMAPRYMVSNFGNVYDCEADRQIRQEKVGPGYCRVYLNVGNVRIRRYVHVLVSEAFLGPRPPFHEVDHIDEDKSNNRADNLEYCTHSENVNRSYRRGRIPAGGFPPISVRCLETGEVFPSQAAAARAIGAHKVEIRNVLRGKQRTARGYRFEVVS